MLRKAVLPFVLALGGLTLSYPSLACERVGVDQQFAPPPRPIQLTLAEQAAELRSQADRLDARAAIDDRTASTLNQEGESLLARARSLRIQASNASEIERSSLFARAEALASQASADLSQAAQLRNESMQLRARARQMRDRAIQLVSNGGGGWRGRPVPRTTDLSAI